MEVVIFIIICSFLLGISLAVICLQIFVTKLDKPGWKIILGALSVVLILGTTYCGWPAGIKVSYLRSEYYVDDFLVEKQFYESFPQTDIDSALRRKVFDLNQELKKKQENAKKTKYPLYDKRLSELQPIQIE